MVRRNRWISFLEKKEQKGWIRERLKEVETIADIVLRCKKEGLFTERMFWGYFSSSYCESYYTDDGDVPIEIIIGASPHLGCGFCNGCKTRFAQGVICLRTCQGLGDSNTVVHWHHIFHHTTYKNYDLTAWATIKPEELSGLTYTTSCYYRNTKDILAFLQQVYRNNSNLPKTLIDVMQFTGFGMKTACLLFSLVYGKAFGIPADRHVISCALTLGWVGDDDKLKDNPDEVSLMMMDWLPIKEWDNVNVNLGSIKQLLDSTETKKKLQNILEKMNRRHQEIVQKIETASISNIRKNSKKDAKQTT